jgi:hypothetical protein
MPLADFTGHEIELCLGPVMTQGASFLPSFHGWTHSHETIVRSTDESKNRSHRRYPLDSTGDSWFKNPERVKVFVLIVDTGQFIGRPAKRRSRAGEPNSRDLLPRSSPAGAGGSQNTNQNGHGDRDFPDGSRTPIADPNQFIGCHRFGALDMTQCDSASNGESSWQSFRSLRVQISRFTSFSLLTRLDSELVYSRLDFASPRAFDLMQGCTKRSLVQWFRGETSA